MAIDRIEIIGKFELFRILTEDQLSFIASRAKDINLNRFDHIYREQDEASSIYLLYKGSVKLGKLAEDGREAIKEVLHSPNLFGFSVFHGDKTRQDFAQALNNDISLLEIPLADIKYLMQSNHGFCLRIIATLSRKLSRRENRMAAMMIHDARGRIIDFIKKSASERGRQVGLETLVKHSLTQQDIANMTGTSRQTVTHVLNDLKKSNLIHFNRKSILIRDLEKLA